ncbi:MAG: hypothetical protein ABEI31_11420 [Halodesulfurarchaeum sp.]
MTDRARGDEQGNDVPQRPDTGEPDTSIEVYETNDGVVLYDADNPLAWLQSSAAVSLGDRL